MWPLPLSFAVSGRKNCLHGGTPYLKKYQEHPISQIQKQSTNFINSATERERIMAQVPASLIPRKKRETKWQKWKNEWMNCTHILETDLNSYFGWWKLEYNPTSNMNPFTRTTKLKSTKTLFKKCTGEGDDTGGRKICLGKNRWDYLKLCARIVPTPETTKSNQWRSWWGST